MFDYPTIEAIAGFLLTQRAASPGCRPADDRGARGPAAGGADDGAALRLSATTISHAVDSSVRAR